LTQNADTCSSTSACEKRDVGVFFLTATETSYCAYYQSKQLENNKYVQKIKY